MWIGMFLCSFYWSLQITISNDPSSTNIRNKFCMQITMLTKIDLDRDMGNEYAKKCGWIEDCRHRGLPCF